MKDACPNSRMGNGAHEFRIQGTPRSAMTYRVCDLCGERQERGPGAFYRGPGIAPKEVPQPASGDGVDIDRERDAEGDLLIDWSPRQGRMISLALSKSGELSYAFLWDGESAHGKVEVAASGAPQEAPGDAPRRIVCAAIRAENGDLILGIRHYSTDMHYQIRNRPDGRRFENRHGDDQGFVNTWGEYLTRKEAYVVALANNQIIRPDACRDGVLYSEGLY